MAPLLVPASLWRGGTSRGLLFQAKDLVRFPAKKIDAIVLRAMGTPDPDARQIDGVGGGISSVSKAAIVSQPGDSLAQSELPGVAWADAGSRAQQSWDLIYRFGQVAVKEPSIDWSATCGNMAAAAACAAISWSLLPPELLRSISQSDQVRPVQFNILAASTGEVFSAKVLTQHGSLWFPEPGQGVSIAGVPGLAAPVELRFPLNASSLPTGNPTDTITVDGTEHTVTIASAGLPNVYITAESLSLDPSHLAQSATQLDSNAALHARLEKIRQAAARHAQLNLSAASPKIVLIGPAQDYTTSGGDPVPAKDYDLLVRAVSSQNFHRTVPGTTLSALNVARGIDGTLVARLAGRPQGDIVPIRVGHPAGVADSAVEVLDGQATAVVLTRTAREIMSGNVHV